jgi:hypothetical protein
LRAACAVAPWKTGKSAGTLRSFWPLGSGDRLEPARVVGDGLLTEPQHLRPELLDIGGQGVALLAAQGRFLPGALHLTGQPDQRDE